MVLGLTIERAVLGDLDRELDATRRVLALLPDDGWDFRPQQGCWLLGELADHLLELLFWMQTVLDRDEFDAATAGDEAPAPATGREESLARFDELAAIVRGAARKADAAYLGAPWTLREGEKVILETCRADALRQSCLNHLIHHRGQLVQYLRLRGIAPPMLYEG